MKQIKFCGKVRWLICKIKMKLFFELSKMKPLSQTKQMIKHSNPSLATLQQLIILIKVFSFFPSGRVLTVLVPYSK